MNKTYYKFLGKNGEAIHGTGKWFLPKGGKPGKWMPKIENIELCKRGYHVCERKDLLSWLRKDCWIVEVRGDEIIGDNKSVFSEARLIKKTCLNVCSLRLFSADCAEESLQYVNDKSKKEILKRTIQIARAYAFGLVNEKIRKDAAYASAADAAYASAAYAAAYASAAYAAAYAAAYVSDASAADAASDYAAYAKKETRDWQTKLLEAYILGKVDLKKKKTQSIDWVKKNIKT